MSSPRALPFLLSSLLLASSLQADLLRIVYPDIEQGSSTFVIGPDGTTVVIDGGTGLNATDESVADVLLDLFDAGIVTSIPWVIATHYDEDHIGRLEEVLQFGGVSETAVIYDRGLEDTPGTFAYGDYEFSASFYDRQTITPLTEIDLGSGAMVRAYTVNAELPDMTTVELEGTSQQENARSVSVVVSFGDFDVWIGGDLTGNPAFFADVESPASAFAGDVDIYTVNHHGSTSSSNQTFLTNLKAEIAINQNSASNGFGHPRAEVVQRFLDTDDTAMATPLFFQQNPGRPSDDDSDDSLATGIADPDDVSGATGLPGRITVVSDGTSYRVSGPGFSTVTRSADTGVGTVGDYPPVVEIAVPRAPLVPTSAEGVLLTARVEDEGAVTVEAVWTLDGVAQTPVALTTARGAGDVYTGTIPAQADGAFVRGRIRATDAAMQETVSSTFCWFAGTTPIADARDQDADGFSDYRGCGVRVQGNLTAEPPLFHDFVAQMWVQDATGGIQVFDRTQESLARGDEVAFVGEIGQFGGQTQVDISDDFGNYGHSLIGAGVPPAPLLVTVAQVDETLEGRLIRIDDLTITDGEIPLSGSASLTVTDDGGISELLLRVDEDTDIPTANTPTGTFDLVGLAGQFDSFFPWLSGHQIIPRERTDFLTEEVNHPAVLIHEIHADPHDTAGDANGDGVVDVGDSFVELVNTSYTPVDLSGWTLSDGSEVRHTFPKGSVLPARELAVVFAGGTLAGDFGNASTNGMAQLASTGDLGLDPAGDTVTLSDLARAVVQSVTYGVEANSDRSITRSPDATNTPFVLHTVAGTGRFSPGRYADQTVPTIPRGAVLLTEVLYDASGGDDDFEWVEIVNTTNQAIDLSQLAIGSGGSDYTSTVAPLSGTLPPGAVFVIGGPESSADNGSPVFDLELDFEPDLQNSGSTADGVALFNIPAEIISATAVPIDAVVYGGANSNGLLDETGAVSPPEVGDAPSGASISRTDLAGSWTISVTTPGTLPFGIPMFADGFESGSTSAWN